MSSFDIDDPLGDLLSGGSDDSFFEMNKKIESVTTQDRKKSIFSLPTASELSAPEIHGKTDETKPQLETRQFTVPKKDLSFGTEDLFSDLGFDLKMTSKNKIFDDLSTIPDNNFKKTSNTLETKYTDQSKTVEPVKIVKNSEKSKSDVAGDYNVFNMNDRKSGRRKTIIEGNDPLGTTYKVIKNEDINKSVDMDWLGLNTVSKTTVQIPEPENLAANETKGKVSTHEKILKVEDKKNLEKENAFFELNQDDIQFVINNKIRAQQNILYEMQQKQQKILDQQELHYNEQLKKETQRQSRLEDTIHSQQRKIDSYVQLLMMQPQNLTTEQIIADQSDKNNDKNNSFELESELKRLELEKLHLEDVVSKIQENHERELTHIDKSYKNQITRLEDQLVAMEKRFHYELENLDVIYQKKIDKLTIENTELLEIKHKIMRDNEKDREDLIERLRTKHEKDMHNIQKDHELMISNIRDSKLLEFTIVSENNSYLQTLKTATSNLQNASGDLHTLKDILREDSGNLQTERDILLQAREKNLEDQRRAIENSREANEKERNRLQSLILSLETRLNTLNQASTEEQWTLKEKITSLECEREALEREKCFFREQVRREEERIAFIRESLKHEREAHAKQFEDLHSASLLERSKLETMMRLAHKQTDIMNGARNTAANIAEEAYQKLEEEREKLTQMQNEYEIKKRELKFQEKQLLRTKTDLETAVNSTLARESIAEELITKAKSMEAVLQFKIKMLQSHFKDIVSREKEISSAKLSLSHERMQFEILRKNLYKSRCSLCKMHEKIEDSENMGIVITEICNEPIQSIELDLEHNEINNKSAGLDSKLMKLKMGILTNFDLE